MGMVSDLLGSIGITRLYHLNHRVWTMPSKPCPAIVQGYLDQFGRFPDLQKRGFAFLIDCSGRLFTAKKSSLKDVEGNSQAGTCFYVANFPPVYIAVYHTVVDL